MFCKWCLWSLTYQHDPFAEMILANLSNFQGFLAARTRNSERNTRWYDPKCERVQLKWEE